MTYFRTGSALLALPATAGAAMAQAGSGGYGGGYPHMWGYDGWGMVFGPLMLLFWIALFAGIVVIVVRWLGGSGAALGPRAAPSDTALSVLKARYAKGEIDTAEFNERKAALEG